MRTGFFLFVILLSVILRFSGLDWGGDFFFHPDERNIASAISQLGFPQQLNPHFFAYGSFPIYLVYFTGIILNFFSSCQKSLIDCQISSSQAIFISRFYSALFSILVVISLYFITAKIRGKTAGMLAAFFSTTSIGFIQFAHFGTFEMWLTFLGVLLFYFCLRIKETGELRYLVMTSIILGLLLSTKVLSLVFLPTPLISVFLYLYLKEGGRGKDLIKALFLRSFFIFFLALIVFIISSPFALFDFPSFFSSLKYESSVALGTLPVFYTGEFFNTLPIIFQFTRIYPFLLNPLMTILFIPSFIYITSVAFKKRNAFYFLLFTFYLLVFIPQAFFFAKWTRYMVPTLPFVYIMTAIFLINLAPKIRVILIGISIFASLIFALLYFHLVYLQPDTRILASLWAKEHLSPSSRITSEVYDLGITPFNQYFPNITLFNFYDLGLESQSLTLSSLLSQTDYLLLPSQRIMKTRLTNKKRFPEGHQFYQLLSDQELGFEKIYKTPCNFSCRLVYFGSPVFSLEETTNVFDRPTVFIFQKKKQ